jgi:HrpA-like RNA helicase
VSSLPLDPIYGHLIFHAVRLECPKEVLTAVAMLSAESVLFFPPPGTTTTMTTTTTTTTRVFVEGRRGHHQEAVHDGAMDKPATLLPAGLMYRICQMLIVCEGLWHAALAGDEERRAQASLAHKSLAAFEGDVPTLIHIYERWAVRTLRQTSIRDER